jgi:hypothetical protein
MAKYFFILLLVLSGGLEVSAQITGHVNYQKIGIELDIPDGWYGQETENGLILGSQSIPGLVSISTHNYTKQQLINQAKQGIYDQNGTSLQLAGQLMDIDENTVGGVFNGMLEYQNARAFIIGKSNPTGGLGVTILTATLTNMYTEEHENVTMQISNSIKFTKIDRSSELKEWKDWLSNVRLTYMDSYYSSDYTDGGVSGGYSSEETIDLCAKGYFNFNSSSDVSVSGSGVSGLAYGSDAGAGNWDIQIGATGDFVLVLTFHSGEQNTYTLTFEDQKLYLNGYRYFRTTEGEYAPRCY